jgi:hypothetical protein
MLKYIRFLVVTSIVLFVIGKSDALPADPVSENLDILGLRLGLTGQEAEAVIQQKLKLSRSNPRDGYSMHSTPRRYQPDGDFIDEFVVSNDKMELILDFTEVYPGKGSGPEELYYISYTPKHVSADDKAEFVRRVISKFGKPAVENETSCFWTPVAIDQSSKTEVPVLELDKATPRMALSNRSIRQRMEDAFRATQKIPI